MRETRERETTEREREKTGIKSVRLEDCFGLQFDWPEWIGRAQTTSNQQRTNQQHYKCHALLLACLGPFTVGLRCLHFWHSWHKIEEATSGKVIGQP